MSPLDPKDDANFREYAALQLRRHALRMEEKGDGPELETIEDQMTDLWEQLDATQRRSVNGMGSDLNWIRRKGEPPPKGRSFESVPKSEIQLLVAMREREEWHGLFSQLRTCASALPSSKVAYLRGVAYNAIRLPGYSACFYELAADLEPANASMGVLALQALERAEPAKAILRAERFVASATRWPPAVVAVSSVMLMRRDEAEGTLGQKADYYVRVLQDAVERLPLEPPSDAGLAIAHQYAACGFEMLGDTPAALKCYDQGLGLSPSNKALLIGKGMLLYGSQTDQAVAALLRAVSNEGSPLVWPYFFLAHHYLAGKKHDESLRMSHEAWKRTKASQVKLQAELLELQAICQTEMGFPPEAIRARFGQAVSLDPANERIQRNFDAFETALSAQRKTDWGIESPAALRVETAKDASPFDFLAVA